MTQETGVPLILKYDYQETQTVWKTRMETQDKLWSKNRTSLHKSIIESLPICKEAACSNCSTVGSTPVRCQTCRTRLCSACDKVVHTKTVTHQRVCEVKGSLHQMLPTEFLNNMDSLETISMYCVLVQWVCSTEFYFIRCTSANTGTRSLWLLPLNRFCKSSCWWNQNYCCIYLR